MVLDVTAKDANGKELFSASKKYFEIGVDTDRDMRYGAWQIKELIDLTLPPMQTQKEQFLMHFDTDTDEAEIEVKLWYYLSGAKGEEVYAVKKKLTYETD